MTTLPRRTEDPALRKTIITNTCNGDQRAVNLFMWADGGMAIETKPGEIITLDPAQVAELYIFFGAERVKARMLDVLRRQLYRSSDVGRQFVKAFDRWHRREQRNDQPAA
jgi:hypothetical protein